jgi:hypothetical protein
MRKLSTLHAGSCIKEKSTEVMNNIQILNDKEQRKKPLNLSRRRFIQISGAAILSIAGVLNTSYAAESNEKEDNIIKHIVNINSKINKKTSKLESIDIFFSYSQIQSMMKKDMFKTIEGKQGFSFLLAEYLWDNVYEEFKKFSQAVPVNIEWWAIKQNNLETVVEIEKSLLKYLEKYAEKFTNIKGSINPTFWLKNEIKQDLISSLMAQAYFAKDDTQAKKQYRKDSKNYISEIIQAKKNKDSYVSQECFAHSMLYYYLMTDAPKAFRLSEKAFTKHLMNTDEHIQTLTKNSKTYKEATIAIQPRIYYEMGKVLGDGYYSSDAADLFHEAYKAEQKKDIKVLTSTEKVKAHSLSIGLKAKKSVQMHYETWSGPEYDEFTWKGEEMTRKSYQYLIRLKKWTDLMFSKHYIENRSLYEYLEGRINAILKGKHAKKYHELRIQKDSEKKVLTYQTESFLDKRKRLQKNKK